MILVISGCKIKQYHLSIANSLRLFSFCPHSMCNVETLAIDSLSLLHIPGRSNLMLSSSIIVWLDSELSIVNLKWSKSWQFDTGDLLTCPWGRHYHICSVPFRCQFQTKELGSLFWSVGGICSRKGRLFWCLCDGALSGSYWWHECRHRGGLHGHWL